MTYSEKAEIYQKGASDPEGVQAALCAAEAFILRFNDAYHHDEPEVGKEIYQDLVNEYLSDFCWKQR